VVQGIVVTHPEKYRKPEAKKVKKKNDQQYNPPSSNNQKTTLAQTKTRPEQRQHRGQGVEENESGPQKLKNLYACLPK